MSYLPCELHCDSIYSNGDFTLNELLHYAQNDHLALIALTDKNICLGYDELEKSSFPTVNSVEWTTPYGNILSLGAKEFVDCSDADLENIDDKVNQIKAVGGVVGIAQPFGLSASGDNAEKRRFNISVRSKFDYIEVFSGDILSFENNFEKALDYWTELLDKGLKLPAVYGRGVWKKNDGGHFGCTYLDMDEPTASQAVRAIRMGKTVASSGAKFFYRLHRYGETFSMGDTIKKGLYTFSFFTDLHSRMKNIGEEEIKYSTIKVITNGGKAALETVYDTRHERLRLEKNHWYRAELWGFVNGEKRPLAVASPVYCE